MIVIRGIITDLIPLDVVQVPPSQQISIRHRIELLGPTGSRVKNFWSLTFQPMCSPLLLGPSVAIYLHRLLGVSVGLYLIWKACQPFQTTATQF